MRYLKKETIKKGIKIFAKLIKNKFMVVVQILDVFLSYLIYNFIAKIMFIMFWFVC